jgi:APA family basic amino acid/polyamine antiporter
MTEKPHLKQALGLYSATAIVIGSVIGSGIFVSSAGMARQLPSGWVLIAVWIFTGLMTILGALTQGELCSRMPLTGGLYVYFRAVFGDTLAFFYGWANFMIAGSGAIAAIAYIFAGYLGEFIPLWHAPKEWQEWAVHIPYVGSLFPAADLGEKMVGTILILFLTAINVRGIRLGALVQSISSTAKVLAIALLVVAAFLFHGTWSHLKAAPLHFHSKLSLMALCFTAMGGAFWSYDGWGNVGYIGGEIRNPQKNLPLSILLGVGIVITTYLLVNLAYLYVLPLSIIGSAPGDRVATSLMNSVAGSSGVMIVSALILLSTFDTVNSSILTNGRVYYAMAIEGLFWKPAGRVSVAHQTPAVSLWLQGAWSIVLLVSGSFDLITSMYVFVNWLFYFLIPVALFIIRYKERSTVQSPAFKVPFYPWLPLTFALFTFAYVVQTFIADVQGYQAGEQPSIKSLMGLLLVLAGAPFLLLLKRRSS